MERHHLVETIQTLNINLNIVIFYLNEGEDESRFIQEMKNSNILLIGMGEGKLRFVTHMDYTQEMHFKCLDKIKAFNR